MLECARNVSPALGPAYPRARMSRPERPETTGLPSRKARDAWTRDARREQWALALMGVGKGEGGDVGYACKDDNRGRPQSFPRIWLSSPLPPLVIVLFVLIDTPHLTSHRLSRHDARHPLISQSSNDSSLYSAVYQRPNGDHLLIVAAYPTSPISISISHLTSPANETT